MRKKLPLLLLFAVLVHVWCYGQNGGEAKSAIADLPRFTIKNNLLYGALATPNIGVEFGVSEKTTLDIPINWNPFTFADNRKWKHILLQPEFRWWTCERFNGQFIGVHAHYALYNVGNLPKPPFSQNMMDHRYDGWLAGAGVSYGYQFYLSSRFNLELAIGAGYAYLDYKKYNCPKCGELIGEDQTHYFGPTKAAISLVYFIK